MNTQQSPTDRMDEERQFLETLFTARFNAYLVTVGLFSVSLTSSATNWTGRSWFLGFGTVVSAIMFLTLWRTHRLISRALNIIRGDKKHPGDKEHPYYILTEKPFFPWVRANSIMVIIPILLTIVFFSVWLWSIACAPPT